MFIGAIADRWFASEYVMAASHLIGAVLLFVLAKVKTPFGFYWIALLYALAYAPTLALVNSIVFAHVPDATRDFPLIRVAGTIGWILAGLSLKVLLKSGQPVNNRPIMLAGALSIVLGIASFYLPHTPPSGEGEIPFIAALNLLKEPSFAIFFGVSFLVTIALAFYFSFTAIFLERRIGVNTENIGPLMTIGQMVEIFFMFSLGWFIKTLGMEYVLALGILAWILRYAFFAIGSPFLLILLGIGLHGICFDFFLGAGFIHVENTAPAGIRASAQQLFSVVTYGLGMYIGTEASGWLNQWLTREEKDPASGAIVRVTRWRAFWLVPCVGAVIALALFLLQFPAAETPADPTGATAQAAPAEA
jgi:nucleoside transporter